MKKIRIAMFVVCLINIVGCIVYDVVAMLTFDNNCAGYIKRAATTSNVEFAIESLDKAIDYAEKHGLTHGSTDIIMNRPGRDISYWYENMVITREELEAVRNSTPEEKTNVLMKVNETLVSNYGEAIYPSEIHLYPYETLFFILLEGSVILAIILGIKLS